jgi:hypothetical protein
MAFDAFFVISLRSRLAFAVETNADVETDHITASDDGGPRTVGLLVRPLAMATGWVGAEIDAATGENVVMSVEGAERWVFGRKAARVDVGLALYPQRFSFHGVYVHPVVEWDLATGDALAASALGGGCTVGYAWTWPAGATVRLGGGLAYTRVLAATPDAQGTFALAGLRARLDGDIGWVF